MQPAGRFSGKTKMQECRNANVRRDAGAPQSRKAELQKTQNCKTAGGRGGAGASQSRKAELQENAGLQNCGRTRRRRSIAEQESGAAGKRGTAKLREAVKAQERRTRSVKTEMEVSDESGMVAEGALQGL